ncbi:hypothetical protein BKA65DRAFT_542076 [Rhexocercosporidium sp. MPI-PUGE-AT-0058]|nr:hypothetical protein BKA65DRAFT_542076 [Rhexocercosporidium sp. MPI-PUGE-AT-0058]
MGFYGSHQNQPAEAADVADFDASNAGQLGVGLSLRPQLQESKSQPQLRSGPLLTPDRSSSFSAFRSSASSPLPVHLPSPLPSCSPTSPNPKDLAPTLSTGKGHKRPWSENLEREEGRSVDIQQEKRLRLGNTDKESGDWAQIQGYRQQSPPVAGKGNTIQSEERQRTGWSQESRIPRASEGKVCASKSCKEGDKRKQRPADAILDVADIGPVLGSGRTGRVYRCKSESENLAVKMFLGTNSFNREYGAYQIMHAEATQVPILVPRFYEKILLPQELLNQIQSFLDHGPSEDEEVEIPLPPYGLILERLRGPILSQVLSPVNKSLTSSYLTELHESLRATLEAIHELGVVHTDLKENNIMFQTKATTPDHCRIIDFGHAEFQSQLSPKSWKKKCESDKAELNVVFSEAEARLAIKLGLEFLKSNDFNLSTALPSAPEELLDAEALLAKYDHPRKEGNYLESLTSYSPHQIPEPLQSRLAILLKFASRRALEAKPLINKILSLIPNPTDLLALSLVNILFDASRHNKALDLLTLQLSNSSMHPLISARFHERKIQSVIEGKCVWQAHISALKKAMPIFVAAYGKKSVEVLAAKYKLGTAYKLNGEKDLAREIYFESVSEFERVEMESGGTVGGAVEQKVDSDQGARNLLRRWRYEVEAL